MSKRVEGHTIGGARDVLPWAAAGWGEQLWVQPNNNNPPKKASRTVVALEVRVMQLVEVIAGPRPLEAVVTEPGPDRAVDDTGEEDRRVAAERHADERGGVVTGGLDRMHVGAGERGGVVRLVVQRVHVLVQEPTDVREPPLRALFKPGVHAAVDGPELQKRQTATEWTWVVASASVSLVSTRIASGQGAALSGQQCNTPSLAAAGIMGWTEIRATLGQGGGGGRVQGRASHGGCASG